MKTSEKIFGAASALLFVAGGVGIYEEEHNHNVVANACYTITGQPVAACHEQPAEALRHRIDSDVEMFLVLGALGLAAGSAGVMHTLDIIGAGSNPGDDPPGHVVPCRPRRPRRPRH
jgi:hypothetical protein